MQLNYNPLWLVFGATNIHNSNTCKKCQEYDNKNRKCSINPYNYKNEIHNKNYSACKKFSERVDKK